MPCASVKPPEVLAEHLGRSNPEERILRSKQPHLQETPRGEGLIWFCVTPEADVELWVNVEGSACRQSVLHRPPSVVVSAPSSGECRPMCTLSGKSGRRGASSCSRFEDIYAGPCPVRATRMPQKPGSFACLGCKAMSAHPCTHRYPRLCVETFGYTCMCTHEYTFACMTPRHVSLSSKYTQTLKSKYMHDARSVCAVQTVRVCPSLFPLAVCVFPTRAGASPSSSQAGLWSQSRV